MSDQYIKKDEVIKAVAEYISCDYSTEEEAIESATILIETIPTIDIPTWIPCSERLPKEGETVLVRFSPSQSHVWGSSRVIEFGRISSDREELEGVGWEWLDESGSDYWEPDWNNMIIAWTPLPQ